MCWSRKSKPENPRKNLKSPLRYHCQSAKGCGRDGHIITRTTTTPRKEGLFGFNPECDFKTIIIKGNLIECEGEPRPLLRCKESYESVIENNR